MEKAAQVTRETGTAGEKLAQQKQAFQELGKGMIVVGGAMTALTVAVAKTGIEYNTLQQTSRAALTTLLGSAQAANAQMDKLDEFARTSPFSKAVFIQAQQQLLGFGMAADRVVPTLDAIQNAVAATGGSNQDIAELTRIIAQLSGGVKISAETFNQFGMRGVDAAGIIGEAMGKTGAQIREEVTAGTLDADDAVRALTDGMQERFAGAAAGVKDTFAGAMDRVKAAWRDLSADLMKPLVDPNGGGMLVDVLNWAADMMRAFQALPEPIKLTGGALFSLAGFITLVGGTALVSTPQIAAFKLALQTLSISIGSVALAGGIVVGVLAAVAGVVSLVAAEHGRARRLAEDYAAALAQGADSATQFVAEQLAMKDSFLWMDRGSAVENAKKLGIGIEEVTKAVTGSNAEFEAFKEKVDEAYAAAGKTVDAGYAVEQLKNKVTDLRAGQELATQQSEESAEAADSLAGAYEVAADATSTLEQETKAAEDALTAVKTALDNVAGAAMSMAEAKDAAIAAINDMTAAAETEGATLDGTDSASIKLRDSIRDVEMAHRDSAQAIIENGGTLEEAIAAWESGREAVVNMRVAKGEDIETANRWADENLGSAEEVKGGIDEVYRAWLNLPENKQTKYEVEKAEAERKLAELKASLEDMPTYKRITLEAYRVGNFDVSIPGSENNAAGGLYRNKMKAFAAGGFEPGIYPYRPGGIHKMAEEYSEAYISMDPARRSRSYGVWQQVGREFGFSQQAPVDVSGLLDGVSISGTLDLGNGLTGFIDGRVMQVQRAATVPLRGGRRR